MSAHAEPTAAPAPKKGRKLMILIVGIVFAGAGAAVPMFVNVPAMFAKEKKDKSPGHKPEGKTAIVPFGDIVVNLADNPKMGRYIKLKIALLVEADAEEEVTELINKNKVAVKSKLISHIAGKDIKEVSGSVGVNRLQRELLERFEDVLYPEGHTQLRSVLFEEYVIQ